VNLKNYHLEKGAYSLQVIYFAGKSISNMVDPRQILEDEEAYDAKIYQGCARSNKVALCWRAFVTRAFLIFWIQFFCLFIYV